MRDPTADLGVKFLNLMVGGDGIEPLTSCL